MKILVVSLNYSPEPTATGKYTGEMAEWLSSLGHETCVITTYPHYPQWKVFPEYKNFLYKTEKINGVTIYRVPCYIPSLGTLGTWSRIIMEMTFSFFSLRFWVPILFGRRQYDVVVAVCPPMQTAIFPLIYSKIRGVPFLFHVQDFQVDMAFRLGMLEGNLLSKMLYFLEGKLLSHATAVSTITPTMLAKAVEKGASNARCFLFPNWANLELVKPHEKQNSLRKRFGYHKNDFIVLYSGGMGAKQGLEIILGAAQITSDRQNIHYLVVGDGEAKKGLMDIASHYGLENLRFLPLQPIELLPYLLSSCDVALIVQKSESADFVMPSKLANILASGRPVIATAHLGTDLADLILNKNIGKVCAPNSDIELAKAVIYMSENPGLGETMGKAAREYAEVSLDKKAILEKFEWQLRKIASLD